MIHLYFWPTPNALKISIALEEMGLPYRVHPVNIGRGEQYSPAFLSMSPNNRVPAILDDETGTSVFESGAILQYLAERTGRFLPDEGRPRYEVLQWLSWQMAGIGPMCGQAHHFREYAPEPQPYAVERYTREVSRLYRVLDARLADREFVAGEYSIADMAIFPWIAPWKTQGQVLIDTPNVSRWFAAVAARPAVIRGRSVARDLRTPLDAEARRVLFGHPVPAGS
ncbi:MAG: thiol:disulfide oxidoreductase [Myxococcales bacterium]|nr:thiol:disulfide oxidoreductase [Myxococcales bacterium]